MVGVRPSARFARKGIASTLFRLSAEVGRKRNFKRCVTECTGHYSQTAARKAGFLECERLAYRDFRFQGPAVFAGIETPHTDVILRERGLSSPKPRHSFFEATHYSDGETANV
jgi:hypothetical protein